jgi:hypothetical protein
MTLSVRSSHSPPLPRTMPPMPDAPVPRSLPPSSIKSALVHTTIMGTPAELCVRVPGPSGSTVLPDMEDTAGAGSIDGSE